MGSIDKNLKIVQLPWVNFPVIPSTEDTFSGTIFPVTFFNGDFFLEDLFTAEPFSGDFLSEDFFSKGPFFENFFSRTAACMLHRTYVRSIYYKYKYVACVIDIFEMYTDIYALSIYLSIYAIHTATYTIMDVKYTTF